MLPDFILSPTSTTTRISPWLPAPKMWLGSGSLFLLIRWSIEDRRNCYVYLWNKHIHDEDPRDLVLTILSDLTGGEKRRIVHADKEESRPLRITPAEILDAEQKQRLKRSVKEWSRMKM